MATKHPDIFTPEEAAEYLSSPAGGRGRAVTGAVVGKRSLSCGAEFRSEGALTMPAMHNFNVNNPDYMSPERMRARVRELEEANGILLDRLNNLRGKYDRLARYEGAGFEKARRVRRTNRTLNHRLAIGQTVHEVPSALASLDGRVCQFACKLIAPPCVYFLLEQGEVVYVGQTTNLLQRIADHYAGGEGKTFDEVYYLPVRQAELSRVERAFIAKLSPPLNESRPFVEPADAERVCKKFEVTA